MPLLRTAAPWHHQLISWSFSDISSSTLLLHTQDRYSPARLWIQITPRSDQIRKQYNSVPGSTVLALGLG